MAPSTCATSPTPMATACATRCVSPFPILAAQAARSQTTGRWHCWEPPAQRTLDSTGQYLPHGNALNAMALGGPVQGQILGATTFTNSGIIDLQANPAVGDVLLISGGHTAGSRRWRNLHFQRRVASVGHGAQQRRTLTVRRAGGRSSWPRRRRPDPDLAEYRRCRRPDRR